MHDSATWVDDGAARSTTSGEELAAWQGAWGGSPPSQYPVIIGNPRKQHDDKHESDLDLTLVWDEREQLHRIQPRNSTPLDDAAYQRLLSTMSRLPVQRAPASGQLVQLSAPHATTTSEYTSPLTALASDPDESEGSDTDREDAADYG